MRRASTQVKQKRRNEKIIKEKIRKNEEKLAIVREKLTSTRISANKRTSLRRQESFLKNVIKGQEKRHVKSKKELRKSVKNNVKMELTRSVSSEDGKVVVFGYFIEEPLFVDRPNTDLMVEILKDKTEEVTKRVEVQAMGSFGFKYQVVWVCDPKNRCDANTKSGSMNKPKDLPAVIRRKIANKHGDPNQSPTDWWFSYFQIKVYQTSVAGSCDTREHLDIKTKFLDKTFEVWSVKSKNDNCGPQSLYHQYGIKKRVWSVRKKLKVPKTGPLSPKQLEPFAVDANIISFGVINFENNVMHTFGTVTENTKWLMLKNNHYFVMKEKVEKQVVKKEKKRCEKCGTLFTNKHNEKSCARIRSFKYDKLKKNPKTGKALSDEDTQRKMLITKALKQDKNLYPIYCDFEAFPDAFEGGKYIERTRKDGTKYVEREGKFKVYSVGYCEGKDGQFKHFTGKETMEKFLDYIELKSQGTLIKRKKYYPTFIFWNAVKFDTSFIIRGLEERGIDCKFMWSSGRLLNVYWQGGKIWDPCQFIKSSLKDACESFKVADEHCKKDFDHTKIQGWDDVEEHKEEMIDYLKNDVISMKLICEKFIARMQKLFGAAPTQYITISQMAYEIWNSTRKHDIFELTQKQFDFVNESVYGGRTAPFQDETYTEYYQEIIEKWKMMGLDKEKNMKEDDVRLKDFKSLYDKVFTDGEFLFNLDINSMYPFCLVGGKIANEDFVVKYPIGQAEWKNSTRENFEKYVCGVYEIEWKAPKHLYLPCLAMKDLGLDWKCGSGFGTYTNVDVQIALDAGYEVTFKGQALVWKKAVEDLFTEYIMPCYKLKTKAKMEGDAVNKTIFKLMMNALYGKLLQGCDYEETKIVKNHDEMIDFYASHNVRDFTIFSSSKGVLNQLLMVGHQKVQEKEPRRKPKMLGAFCLAYSRKLYVKYWKMCNPTLDRKIGTYSDTDSIHVYADNYHILNDAGVVDEEKMGYLSNDIKHGGLIIGEIAVAPKQYAYISIDKFGRVKLTMKHKGINNKLLTFKDFETRSGRVVEWMSIKMIGRILNSKERERNLKPFDMTYKYMKRTIGTSWAKQKLVKHTFLPIDYCGDQYETQE